MNRCVMLVMVGLFLAAGGNCFAQGDKPNEQEEAPIVPAHVSEEALARAERDSLRRDEMEFQQHNAMMAFTGGSDLGSMLEVLIKVGPDFKGLELTDNQQESLQKLKQELDDEISRLKESMEGKSDDEKHRIAQKIQGEKVKTAKKALEILLPDQVVELVKFDAFRTGFPNLMQSTFGEKIGLTAEQKEKMDANLVEVGKRIEKFEQQLREEFRKAIFDELTSEQRDAVYEIFPKEKIKEHYDSLPVSRILFWTTGRR
jgi:hypothetical protein